MSCRRGLWGLVIVSWGCVPSPPAIAPDSGLAVPDSGLAARDAGHAADDARAGQPDADPADAFSGQPDADPIDADSPTDALPVDAQLGPPDAGAPADSGVSDSGPRPDAGSLTSTSCQRPSPPFSPLEQALADLPADRWYEAPNTPMRPLCPPNIDGCANIINAWSGGAWDDVHQRMLVFGGGHGDYAGNELFAFDLATLSWSLLSDASDPSFRSMDPLPDGKPVSRHSYDGLQYLTHANVFWAHGGSRWQDGSGTNLTWTYASETNTWTNMMPTGNAVRFAGCCSESSIYDPVTRLVFDKDNNLLRSYDLSANVWTELADLGLPPLWPRYAAAHEPTGGLDALRRTVWFVGGNLFLVYDIASSTFITDSWATTGGSNYDNSADIGGHSEQRFTSGGGEVITAQGPGFAYDPSADDFVAFVSGAPWILDLTTKQWSRGSATGAPERTMNSRGTYGRWRYIPRVNAFILVNDVDENVYFYKHTAGCGG